MNRGEFVTEFTASVAEGEYTGSDLMWDHPEWLDGWWSDGKPYTPPFVRALPWVTDFPPTRCMFRPQSQWDAELARGES